jgi:orotate phosphoribosyltransferase-like protein
MAKPVSLTQEQITLAKRLRSIGYSNRDISDILNIAKSTIWDNIYDERRQKVDLPPFRRIQIAIQVVHLRKQQGRNSREVAEELNIPLGEVNYMWTV